MKKSHEISNRLDLVVNWNYVNRSRGGVTHIYDEETKKSLCGLITDELKGWESIEGNIKDAGCMKCKKILNSNISLPKSR